MTPRTTRAATPMRITHVTMSSLFGTRFSTWRSRSSGVMRSYQGMPKYSKVESCACSSACSQTSPLDGRYRLLGRLTMHSCTPDCAPASGPLSCPSVGRPAQSGPSRCTPHTCPRAVRRSRAASGSPVMRRTTPCLHRSASWACTSVRWPRARRARAGRSWPWTRSAMSISGGWSRGASRWRTTWGDCCPWIRCACTPVWRRLPVSSQSMRGSTWAASRTIPTWSPRWSVRGRCWATHRPPCARCVTRAVA